MIGRRGFLQVLVGVPLAVKAFVSPVSAPIPPPVLQAALTWTNSHDWFNFTISGRKEVDRWQSWNDPRVVHFTPIGDTEYTIEASCYGHHDDLMEAMRADRPVVVHLPDVGRLQIRLDSISVNAQMDCLQTTDISGTITEMVLA